MTWDKLHPSMQSETRVERQPRRVAAWIYAVVNPTVESLRQEFESLQSRNIGWRSHSKRCESLRPILGNLDVAHRPIYEDFVAERIDFKKKFEEHDSTISSVETAAGRFFEGLINSSLFRDQVRKKLEDYHAGRSPSARDPDLSNIQTELPAYVAECLVNRVETLPNHYTIHAFWEGYWKQAGDDFQPYQLRETFQLLLKKEDELKQIVGGLRQELEALRLELCRIHDIPAAPILPPRNLVEDVFHI